VTTSRTAKLGAGILLAEVLALIVVVLLARLHADPAAYEAIGWIALGIAGGTGAVGAVHGARHVALPGARTPTGKTEDP